MLIPFVGCFHSASPYDIVGRERNIIFLVKEYSNDFAYSLISGSLLAMGWSCLE